MLRKIQDCFKLERILFTKHAKDEKDEETVIIITAYQPNPERWIDFERRKK